MDRRPANHFSARRDVGKCRLLLPAPTPMTSRVWILLLATALACAPFAATAHHGQDFLLVESPTVPHPGDVYFLANAAAALDNDAQQQAGFEPALLIGVCLRLAFELHAHTEKLAGEDWNYEATAPSLHLLLTDPENHDGLKAGLSAEYEIAREADAADRLEV